MLINKEKEAKRKRPVDNDGKPFRFTTLPTVQRGDYFFFS